MRLTKHFYLHEFISKKDKIFPNDEQIENLKYLAQNLEKIRSVFNKPILINSGFRSTIYNRVVGGVLRSQHLLGKAADIRIKGVSSKHLADEIKRLINEGVISKGGVGLYDTFVHYDTRGKKVLWDYRKKKRLLIALLVPSIILIPLIIVSKLVRS